MSESPEDDKKRNVPRRDFFKSAAAGAAAIVATGSAETAEAAAPPPARPAVVPPTEAQAQAELGGSGAQAGAEPGRQFASDFMVDVLRSLDIDYAAINPGSSFEGIHESMINHGGNTRPEIITCLHEEAAAAMCHGYAKASGKPMMAMFHGTVGLLHAGMGIFQCWADRVPAIYLVAHNRTPTSVVNRPHSAQDMGALVRDFVKWDDEPTTLERFAESAVRGYRIAMTPPRGPVLLVVDSGLQDMRVEDPSSLRIPALSMASPPQGDANAVREAARMLVDAERPLIRLGKLAWSPEGWDRTIELAEALQAPVDVGGYGGWGGFPSRHPLYGSGGSDYTPDVVLGLELNDMTGDVRRARSTGGRTIGVCAEYLFQGSNIHDFGNYAELDLTIAADGEATLPSLIEEVQRATTGQRRRELDERGARIGAVHAAARAAAVREGRFGWNKSPVSVPRMVAELRERIKDDDWAMVSGYQFTGPWQRRLLNFDRPHRYNGDSGGFGIGYDSPASVGAALANKGTGRLSIGIVGDGDLNFSPGVLWTAAHHRIPLLLVVHNNGGYHAEVMIVERVAGRRGRGLDQSHIGNVFVDPSISYAKMAEGYGMYSEGPIENPDDLGPAFARALERVRAGEPALVDVVSQPR